MKGLIYRDFIAFFRRTSKISWVLDAIFLLVFLFAVKGPAAVPTYLLLVQPINISGSASTLKELDTNYSSRFSLTLPVSHSQHVLSRFLSAYLLLLVHLPENMIFTAVHYAVYEQYSLSGYLFYFAAGLLTALFMTAINVTSTFTMGINGNAIFYVFTILAMLLVYVAHWFLDLDFAVILNLTASQSLALGAAAAGVCAAVCYVIAKKLYLKKLG